RARCRLRAPPPGPTSVPPAGRGGASRRLPRHSRPRSGPRPGCCTRAATSGAESLASCAWIVAPSPSPLLLWREGCRCRLPSLAHAPASQRALYLDHRDHALGWHNGEPTCLEQRSMVMLVPHEYIELRADRSVTEHDEAF